MRLQFVLASAVAALVSIAAVHADPVPMPAPLASGVAFVQDFYDWYVPKVFSNKADEPAEAIALREKKDNFDPKLAKALKDDLDAQAKVSDDIVGLDFDPFLYSQDPSHRFVTGAARWREKDKVLLVDVYSVEAGKKSAKPDVVDELGFENGHWVFVNFDYPDGGGDLVSTLATLKAEREKHQ